MGEYSAYGDFPSFPLSPGSLPIPPHPPSKEWGVKEGRKKGRRNWMNGRRGKGRGDAGGGVRIMNFGISELPHMSPYSRSFHSSLLYSGVPPRCPPFPYFPTPRKQPGKHIRLVDEPVVVGFPHQSAISSYLHSGDHSFAHSFSPPKRHIPSRFRIFDPYARNRVIK